MYSGLDPKNEAKKVKGYVRFATSRLSFAKSPELASLKQRRFFNALFQPVCLTLIARGPRAYTKRPVLYNSVETG